MTKSKLTLGDLEASLGLVDGASLDTKLRALVIECIAEAGESKPGSLVFVAGREFLDRLHADAQKPAVVVTSSAMAERMSPGVPVVRVKNPMLAFAKCSVFFSTEMRPTPAVHSSAVIHETAKIGQGVSIGPGCVIADGAVIGDGCVLHPRVFVGSRTQVGAGSVIFPGVVLYQDVMMGERVRIHANSVIGADGFGYAQEFSGAGVKHVKIHHFGGVKIGNDVEIGAATTIDRGTVRLTEVGNGCIIDNNVQIGHNCRIGEGVIICGNTGLAGSAEVDRFAVLAGYVAVGNQVKVGAGAQVAGFSMVWTDVPAGAKWGGVPGRPLKEFWRIESLISRLPELFDAYKISRKGKSSDGE